MLDLVFLPVIIILITFAFNKSISNKKKKKAHISDIKLSAWSHKVRKRDNYTCAVCSSRFRPEAHHIFSKDKYPRWALSLKNGITLCRECHRTGRFAYHHIMGRTSSPLKFYSWYVLAIIINFIKKASIVITILLILLAIYFYFNLGGKIWSL